MLEYRFVMLERNCKEIIRNSVVTAILIPASHFTANSEQVPLPENCGQTNTQSLTNKQLGEIRGASLFGNLDELIQTKEGKIIVDALFAAAIFQAAVNLQRGWELDRRRKMGEAIIASTFLVALTASLATEQFTGVNDQMKAALLFGWALSQNAYMIEHSLEREKQLRKRGAVLGAAVSLQAIATTVLIDTFQ